MSIKQMVLSQFSQLPVKLKTLGQRFLFEWSRATEFKSGKRKWQIAGLYLVGIKFAMPE